MWILYSSLAKTETTTGQDHDDNKNVCGCLTRLKNTIKIKPLRPGWKFD